MRSQPTTVASNLCRVATWIVASRRHLGMALFASIGLGDADPAEADSVNSPNIVMNADTNRSAGIGAGNVAVTVNTITIAETQLPEYTTAASAKSFTIQVKPGFQFDSSSAIVVNSTTMGFNDLAIGANASVTPTGAANEFLTFRATSGATQGVQDVIKVNGIKLKILDSTGAHGPAQTTLLLSTSSMGGAFTSQGIVAASITVGAVDHLAFTTQPVATQACRPLLPAVAIVDFGNNVISAAPAANITLQLKTGNSPVASLGTNQRTTESGAATWVAGDNYVSPLPGTAYQIVATNTGATLRSGDTATSGTFAVTGGIVDPDANCVSDALTDGLMLLRYQFGLRGPSLTANAVAPNANRTDPDAIAAYIATILP